MLKAFFLLLKSAAPKAEAGLLLRQPEGNGILICQIGGGVFGYIDRTRYFLPGFPVHNGYHGPP